MNLRVLTVLGGGGVGGAEAFFVALTVAFKRAGIETRAVLKSNPIHQAALAVADVPHALAPFGGPLDFLTRFKLRAAARRFRPDIVLGFASRANAHIPRGPYVHIGRLGGYYKLRHFRSCDWLVCNAPAVLDHVVKEGWPEARVSLIPNFPDLSDAGPTARADFATLEGVPLALAMGRLHRNKAFDTLLSALSLVPGLHLWIAGEGPERANLEDLARKLGLTERVKFLGWRTDRAALFKAADFCVYPSRQEPFGNVVVEAWGYGVPLVTTASEGPAWLVRAGEDALVAPVDDAAALAVCMQRLLSSPDLARSLAANGRRRVAAEFSQDAIVRRYRDLFEELRR